MLAENHLERELRDRKELAKEEMLQDGGVEGLSDWARWGKQAVLTLFFATALIFICFVGQEPPSLRTIGEVAPENVYSDRAFQYLSEVRKAEAEEWIRSSTPRELPEILLVKKCFLKL